MAAGADTVNVASVVTGGELGELARAFDDMAETLIQEKTALRTSEERWSTTLASIGDAVIAADVEGKITFMNAVAEGLTGWTLKEAGAKPVTEIFNIINEQTRDQVENPVTKVLREGMIVGLANHTVLIRKDGSEAPIDDSGAPIRDEVGNTSGVVLIFRDITERKLAEEELRQSEKRYRELFETMYEGFILGEVITDEQGRAVDHRYLDINPRAEQQFFKRPREEIVGSTYRTVGGARAADEWAELLGNVAITGEPVSVERYAPVGDQWIHLAAYSPRIGQFAAVFENITERKQAEEAVQTTLKRLYTVLASMYGGLLLVTDESRVEFANQAICDYFDLSESPADLVGLTSSEVFAKITEAYLHPDEATARVKEIVDRGQPVANEEVAMRNGRELLRDFIPIRVNGKSSGRLWYHTDITERKAMEEGITKGSRRS